MPQLNLDYKLQIFTPNEIAAIKVFSNEIDIGYFTNFNPPYEIIQLFNGTHTCDGWEGHF